MLLHPTIESLKALRLFGMVRALEEQQQSASGMIWSLRNV